MRLTVQHSVSLLSTLQLTVPDQVRGKETRLKRHPDSAVGDTRNLTGSQAWGDTEVSQGEDQTLRLPCISHSETLLQNKFKMISHRLHYLVCRVLTGPYRLYFKSSFLSFPETVCLSVCPLWLLTQLCFSLHKSEGAPCSNPTNAQVLRGPFLSRKYV